MILTTSLPPVDEEEDEEGAENPATSHASENDNSPSNFLAGRNYKIDTEMRDFEAHLQSNSATKSPGNTK